MFSLHRVARQQSANRCWRVHEWRFVIKRCVRLSRTGLVIGKLLMFCGTVLVF